MAVLTAPTSWQEFFSCRPRPGAIVPGWFGGAPAISLVRPLILISGKTTQMDRQQRLRCLCLLILFRPKHFHTIPRPIARPHNGFFSRANRLLAFALTHALGNNGSAKKNVLDFVADIGDFPATAASHIISTGAAYFGRALHRTGDHLVVLSGDASVDGNGRSGAWPVVLLSSFPILLVI